MILTLALNLAHFDDVDAGHKTSTIRKGRREVQEGSYIRFVGAPHRVRSATVFVREVRHLRVSDLNEDHVRTEGVATIAELKALLREYYRDIRDEDFVTYVRFEASPVADDVQITYGEVNTETFSKACREMRWDIGWASWTDALLGVWNLIGTTRTDLNDHVGARILQSDFERGEITLSFPATNVDWEYNSVPALLSLVGGDVLGSSGVGNSAVVRSVRLPDSVTRQFSGPKLGIGGVRRICKVPDRPIVAFSVKPRLGLTSREFATLCTEAALGGIDIVEDDERLSNQRHSRLLERAEVTLEALARSGRNTVYSANITGRADEIVYVAEELVKLGVRMLKIDVLPTGYSALQAVSEWLHTSPHDVAITVYPAMTRLYERSLPRDFILELAKLCGADMVYAGVPVLPAAGRSHDAVRDFARAAEHHEGLKQRKFHQPVLPTISTSITPMNIGAYAQLLGNDVAFFVGAGIAAYKGGLKAGAELLLKALAHAHDDDPAFFTREELDLAGESRFGEFARYSDLQEEVADQFSHLRE